VPSKKNGEKELSIENRNKLTRRRGAAADVEMHLFRKERVLRKASRRKEISESKGRIHGLKERRILTSVLEGASKKSNGIARRV